MNPPSMKVITLVTIMSSIMTSGCMNVNGRYGSGGFGRMEYSDVQYVYGSNEPTMSYEELEKYNGIRIGSDGYVKSLVQLPQTKREDLPHYTYTPPEYFRDNYERERGWRK